MQSVMGDLGNLSDSQKDEFMKQLFSENQKLSAQLGELTKTIDRLTAQIFESQPKRRMSSINHSANSSMANIMEVDKCVNNETDVNDDSFKDERRRDSMNSGTNVNVTVNGVFPTQTFAEVTATNTNSNARQFFTNERGTKTPTAGTTRPSPIQLGRLPASEYSLIIRGLRGFLPDGSFRWQQIGNHALPRIFASDHDTKTKITDWLGAAKYEYNTYAERNQKRKSFLVRGLAHGDDDANSLAISEACTRVGAVGCVVVKRFLTGYMKRNAGDRIAPIYQLTLDHDNSDAIVAGIKEIGHFGVRVEKMKPSTIVQCRRCQRYQHTTTGCGFAYRCVQCINSHEPGLCPRASNSNLPLGCVNCHAAGLNHVGHTANDHRNCHYQLIRGGGSSTNQVSASGRTSNLVTNSSANLVRTETTAKPIGIIESVRANNPHLSEKKGSKENNNKKRRNNVQRSVMAITGGHVSTGTMVPIAADGPKLGESSQKFSRGDACGRLITALMNVLTSFQ